MKHPINMYMIRTVHLVIMVMYTLSLRADIGKSNDSLKALLKKNLHDTSRINVLQNLARNYRNINTKEALNYGMEAYNLSTKISYPKGKAAAGDMLGVIYLNMANYQKALLYLFASLRLNEFLHNEKGVAGTCNNIGSVYFHLAKYEEATKYYNRSLELKLKLGMKKEASSAYINLANIFMKQNRLGECIDYYNKALKNAEANNDDYNVSVALMNLGEAYSDSKEYTKALNYYNKALIANEKRTDILHIANCNYSIGKILIETKNYKEAEYYLLKGDALATKGNVRSLKLNIYKYLSKLYEREKKYEQSLYYFKLFNALSDSVFNTESAEKISEIETKYESEKKDKQIELLNKDKAINEAKITRETILRNAFIVAFILILITAGVLARNIILKQHVNKILRDKNAEIEKQQLEIEAKNQELYIFNKELKKENISAKYEILKSKVNPHFLFNSLSTLSSLIISNQQEALQFVTHFSKLYRNILEFGNHQLVTLDEEMKLVTHYIYLQKMRFKENLHVDVTIHPNMLKHKVPPFAIQLLIENALKHNIISSEHPLKIEIISTTTKLKVINNLQKKNVQEDSTGIGRQNIIDRYKTITDIEPIFIEENGFYIASLPLI